MRRLHSGDQADYLEQRGFTQDDEVPLVIEGRQIAQLRVRELLP